MSSPAAGYRGYADLAGQQVEGGDYKVHVRANGQSSVAVIAPHGGGIERYSSEIARAITGDEFNLYVFEGSNACLATNGRRHVLWIPEN